MNFARKEGRIGKKKKRPDASLSSRLINYVNTRETRLGAEKAAREWRRLIASAATKWRANVFLLSQLNRVPPPPLTRLRHLNYPNTFCGNRAIPVEVARMDRADNFLTQGEKE